MHACSRGTWVANYQLPIPIDARLDRAAQGDDASHRQDLLRATAAPRSAGPGLAVSGGRRARPTKQRQRVKCASRTSTSRREHHVCRPRRGDPGLDYRLSCRPRLCSREPTSLRPHPPPAWPHVCPCPWRHKSTCSLWSTWSSFQQHGWPFSPGPSASSSSSTYPWPTSAPWSRPPLWRAWTLTPSGRRWS